MEVVDEAENRGCCSRRKQKVLGRWWQLGKQPHNEHELELALTRFSGSNLAAFEYRDIMAGVIRSQMLPPGTVVKGGSSIRLRLGPENSRATVDADKTVTFDAACSGQEHFTVL